MPIYTKRSAIDAWKRAEAAAANDDGELAWYHRGEADACEGLTKDVDRAGAWAYGDEYSDGFDDAQNALADEAAEEREWAERMGHCDDTAALDIAGLRFQQGF